MPALKSLLISTLAGLTLLLAPSHAQAQSPPGWGWAHHLGAANNTQGDNGVAGLGHDAAGNLYLLGTYVGTPAFNGTATTNIGETDVFLAKYSPAGALVWLRTLQSAGFERALALTVESSGRCTLAGTYGAGTTGDNLSLTSFGASFMLAGPSIQGLSNVGGQYEGLSFIAAVDATGNLLWADNPSPTYGLLLYSLRRDNNGNTYISTRLSSGSPLTFNGQAYPAIGQNDAVLMKYTAGGQPAWVRRVGTSGSAVTSGEVYTDNAGAVYWMFYHTGTLTIDQVTVGVTSSAGAMSLAKISAGNRVRWIKNDLLKVGNNNAVSQLLDFDAATNALYISGYSSGGSIAYPGSGSPLAVPANTYTQCVARCDTAGQVQWVKPVAFAQNVPGAIQGPLYAGIHGFAVRGNGFTLVTNTVRSGATSYPGSTRTFGVAEGGLASVVHFNATTFQAEWVRVGGVAATVSQVGAYVTGAAIDAADNAYVAGNFSGTAHFGPTTFTSAISVQPDMFLAKLDQAIPTGTTASAAARPWAVFPNPATGTAQLAGLPAQATVRVYDAQGRLVRMLPAVTNAAQPRTLSGLAPGLYLLQVAGTAEPYARQRLVMQ